MKLVGSEVCGSAGRDIILGKSSSAIYSVIIMGCWEKWLWMDTGSHGDNIATELSEFLYWGLLDIKQVNELLDPNIVYTS